MLSHGVYCTCDQAWENLLLSAKSILLMRQVLQLYSFAQIKQPQITRSALPHTRFLGIYYTQSCETAHLPLCDLVVCFKAQCMTTSPTYIILCQVILLDVLIHHPLHRPPSHPHHHSIPPQPPTIPHPHHPPFHHHHPPSYLHHPSSHSLTPYMRNS